MQFQLLRHATCVLNYHGQQILLDPVFAPKGSLPPIAASPRKRPNPIVELPISDRELSVLATDSDLLLITHTHMDHLDPRAVELINKNTPLVCQPEDTDKLSGYGFSVLHRHKPDVVIFYAGAAQFLIGGRITMSVCDARKIASTLPNAQMIAVHMEAYNHCLLARSDLRRASERHGYSSRLRIPADGETFVI